MAKASKTRKQAKTKKATATKSGKVRTRPRAKAARKNAARKPARTTAGPRARKAAGFALASVAPSLTVNDLDQSLAWYCDVVGFTIGQRWERDGILVGAELTAGDVTVYLSQDDWAKGQERVKGDGFRIYWYTDQDIDQLADGIKRRGGALASEPKDEWGQRAFSLVDPTGYRITISTDR